MFYYFECSSCGNVIRKRMTDIQPIIFCPYCNKQFDRYTQERLYHLQDTILTFNDHCRELSFVGFSKDADLTDK